MVTAVTRKRWGLLELYICIYVYVRMCTVLYTGVTLLYKLILHLVVQVDPLIYKDGPAVWANHGKQLFLTWYQSQTDPT
jgi:hypothetical protein